MTSEPTTPASGGESAQHGVKRRKLALTLVAMLAAVQGSDPNIAATALVGAARGLDMSNTSLAASISTLALAATAITTDAGSRRCATRCRPSSRSPSGT